MDAMTPPAMLQGMPQPPTAPQPPMPLAPRPTTHDVTIVTTKKMAQARVLGIPPEEFGIERAARDIKTCNYAFHEVVTKTPAQLAAEGFDKDQIESLTEYTGLTEDETIARDTVAEHLAVPGGSSTNPAARPVKVTEHYIRMDYEGNGRPCLYMVTTAGDQGEILKKDGKDAIEPIDAIPIAATTPVPMTHRFFGRSMADLVMPIQREKTALKRGALDNLYLHNNPRVEVAEQNAGPNTLDDLLTSRPGGVVRTKTAGGLNWQTVPDITTSIYPMMQYLDAELETRTGVTKQGQGIDANALQNQTATAVAQVFSASQMRMKLIARIMSEGVRDIFSLLHGTIRKHGQQAETVRLRNKWVSVDPRNWTTRDDMTISVGLGTGGKAQQFAQLMALAGIQEKLIAGGKSNLVDDNNIFNLASEISKVMGHKNADRFFNDPMAKDPKTGQLMHPPPPPQPDPKLQIEQAKQQGQMQIAQAKQSHDQAKAQADMLHQQIKAQADIEVAKVKADLDAKIALINAHIAAIQAEQKMRQTAQAHHADMASKVVDIVATAHAHDKKMEQTDAMHQTKMEQMKTKPEKTDG